jgi:hypothetical protein
VVRAGTRRTDSYRVSSNLRNGSSLSVPTTWTATAMGAATREIEFSIDGKVAFVDAIPPYTYRQMSGDLDPSLLSIGTHALTIRGRARDGRTATRTTFVQVVRTPGLPSLPALPIPTPPTAPGPSAAASPGPVAGAGLSSPFPSASPTVADPQPVSGVQAATVGSAPLPRFGISTGFKILNRSSADQAFELDRIRAAGAKIVRLDSLPPAFEQSKLDPVVSGVIGRGMEPLLILFGTTGPIDPATAASFARSQALKWRGRVRLYEFANEPDLQGWTGASYARSLIAVHDAIKSVDPTAVVIAGALWKGAGGPRQFVTEMYAEGAKGHFDILSLHLYDDPNERGDWNIWDQAFYLPGSVRSIMDANGDSAVPIASTESGGPTTKYGEAGQARIVENVFDALRDPRLAFVLVYSMMDDDVPGFGLLRPDRSPRPSFATFQARATSS